MNRVILTGRLTDKPQLKSTTNGKSVVNFTVAVDKFSNGTKGTNFIKCTAFSNKAEFLATYCGKGDKVGVEGSLEVSQYEQDGQKRTYTEVLCDRVELEAKAQNNAQSAPKPVQEEENWDADDIFDMDAEDLPF